MDTISEIIFAICRGLLWRDAPVQYGARKTIYNRFVHWIGREPHWPSAVSVLRPSAALPKVLHAYDEHLLTSI